MLNFENYLCSQNETIYGCAYWLLCAMAEPEADPFESRDEIIPWDVGMIVEVVETAEAVLEKHGIHPCYPFHGDDDKPCYLGNECQKPNCPMKRSAANEDTAL